MTHSKKVTIVLTAEGCGRTCEVQKTEVKQGDELDARSRGRERRCRRK